MKKHFAQLALAGFLVYSGAVASEGQPPELPADVRAVFDECAQNVGLEAPPAPFDEAKKGAMDSCLKEHGVNPPPAPPRRPNNGD